MYFVDFIIAVIVRMIDPLSLVVALIVAWIASIQKATEVRWAVIGRGALVMTMAFAALDKAASVADGRAQSHFDGASALVACFLQICLITLILREWRANANKASKTETNQ
jgi:uncharacterized membrane protein YhhN